MVLHGEPMQFECLKCGQVAPFSVAVGPAERTWNLPAKPPKGEE
jgi:NAD-dependent SIR2 family protein deacetylase